MSRLNSRAGCWSAAIWRASVLLPTCRAPPTNTTRVSASASRIKARADRGNRLEDVGVPPGDREPSSGQVRLVYRPVADSSRADGGEAAMRASHQEVAGSKSG